MRQGKFPRPWPPEVTGPSLDLLDREYAQLTAEFAARKPDEETITWYDPDQTVGFWIRRMAQETVIHRVDAELAATETPAAIPDDLAVDGVDEVLVRFLAYAASGLPEADALAGLPEEVRAAIENFQALLRECDGRTVRVQAGSRSWPVQLSPDGILVGDETPSLEATISGS